MVNNWQSYFDKLICINLLKRIDRREHCEKLFNEYGIDVAFWEAAEHTEGFLGLIITMKAIFEHSISKGYKRILIFEDDVKFIEAPESFNYYMDKCTEQLKTIQWDLFYLGLQQAKNFDNFRTPNLLTTTCGYSTHAVAYNSFSIEYLLDKYIGEPIDNWIVREFQPKGTCFCAYPLLASQIEGYSDIGKNRINWGNFIEPQYEKFIRPLISKR